MNWNFLEQKLTDRQKAKRIDLLEMELTILIASHLQHFAELQHLMSWADYTEFCRDLTPSLPFRKPKKEETKKC